MAAFARGRGRHVRGNGGETVTAAMAAPSRLAAVANWLRESRFGLLAVAALVGVGAGLSAVAFRYLIYFCTWLATGHAQFGQDGYVGSSHLPWLGLAFFVVAPVVGGIIYGPVIYRYAREARGHGVPEVMAAVADNGGRIRPQVSLVKALASALCIGTGGSVGREGPIVQIGSALASSLGQWVKMPDSRMRILVACGAAGGIAATFNAPIAGVFFGVEIILREFAADAMFTVLLSAMLADLVAIPFLGSRPFLSGFPPGITLVHPADYLLVTVLAVVAALIGLAFKGVLYKVEDLWDVVWRNRPEWARPAVGGVALGLLLLALPQMYGVGYPVMYKAVAGNYVLWFLLVLCAGKMLACSLTLGIGGSGGVFAPSLFVGVTSGMAFGEIADHLLGPAAGQPALYAVVAMGAVFASAARAPLTSVASVLEMTGDYTLTLPVMLAVAIATASSRALSYGTIYTTKLLRRGEDIDKTTPWRAFRDLTAADVMRPLRISPVNADGMRSAQDPAAESRQASGPEPAERSASAGLPGPVTAEYQTPALHAGSSVVQAMPQLVTRGSGGLPVLSADGGRIAGWLTDASVLHEVERRMGDASPGRPSGSGAAGAAAPKGVYRVVEVTIAADSPAVGLPLDAVAWPPGYVAVSVTRNDSGADAGPDSALRSGDRVSLLAPATTLSADAEPASVGGPDTVTS